MNERDSEVSYELQRLNPYEGQTSVWTVVGTFSEARLGIEIQHATVRSGDEAVFRVVEVVTRPVLWVRVRKNSADDGPLIFTNAETFLADHVARVLKGETKP